MKRSTSALFLLVLLASCKPNNGKVWTKEYEQKNYDVIYKTLESTISNPEQRKKFAEYTIQNLKKRLPNGLESVSTDSLTKVSATIGEEYARQGKLNSPIAWSADVETSFRQGMMREIAKTIPDKATQQKFCDCMVSGLKKVNADSIMLPLSDTLLARLGKTCLGKK